MESPRDLAGIADHHLFTPMVVVTGVVATCAVFVALYCAATRCFSSTGNDEDIVARPGKNDSVATIQERDDILAEVYGNAGDDGFDADSPHNGQRGKSDDLALKKAWEAISRMDSDEDEINCLVGDAEIDRYVNDDDELDCIAESFKKNVDCSAESKRTIPGSNTKNGGPGIE
mmetsp:Transcript_28425/g.80296  ORF Transcript_28425/g.80296 Transcript_28425/m.80296 type:complete len:173 (-) Transcript_28425:174-692(-)